MTPAQKTRLNTSLTAVQEELEAVVGAVPRTHHWDDEADLHQRVADARRMVGRLDAALFRIFGELHIIRCENHYTAPYNLPVPPPRSFTVDDL